MHDTFGCAARDASRHRDRRRPRSERAAVDDSDAGNGCLQVIPGTHSGSIRAQGTSPDRTADRGRRTLPGGPDRGRVSQSSDASPPAIAAGFASSRGYPTVTLWEFLNGDRSTMLFGRLASGSQAASANIRSQHYGGQSRATRASCAGHLPRCRRRSTASRCTPPAPHPGLRQQRSPGSPEPWHTGDRPVTP